MNFLSRSMAVVALTLISCADDAGSGSTGGASGAPSCTGASGGAGGCAATAGTGGGTGPSLAASVTVSAAGPVSVPATFFGQNYWSWVPEWGDPVAAVEAQTAQLQLGLLRAGGANNDRQEPVRFSFSEIDQFVTFAHNVGAEPLLQVPLLRNIAGETATAEDAAELVTYVNVTQGYGVKYFSIGNEPDLYEEQGLMPNGYDAAAFCDSFREFVAAMRAVDDSIQIVGPDLSWKYQTGVNDWLTPFLQGCGDVTDIVAVHRYPLAPTACTDTAAYADAARYRSVLTHLKGIMAATGQQDKPLALTEGNITWDGDPANTAMAASPGTFPAALWVADNLGVSLEAGLHSVDYWSLSEGWTLGFFDGAAPRPAFHVLKMFSNNFGTQALSVTGTPSGVSVYAGRNTMSSSTSVFVLNKTTGPLELTIEFAEHPRSVPIALSVAPISLQMAIVADDGSPPMITSYSADIAAPTVMPP
jgi:hypothetical protein